MTSPKLYDVIVVGGGVVGSSVAYWLAANPNFRGSIGVIERDASYEYCSTTRSNSCIRQQFSTSENISISQFGIDFLRNVSDHLGVDGEGVDISLVDAGYLFLADETVEIPLRKTLDILQAKGIDDVVWQNVPQLRQRFPWLNTDGLTGGTLGIRNEGRFDPSSLLHAFKRKARALGVTYIEDEVTGLHRKNGKITAVSTQKTGEIACGTVVNAAGARARFVAAMAGIELPVSARKRSVFVFKCKDEVAMEPLVIDPKGMYIRREGQMFICGQQPDADKDPECLDFEVDYPFFEERLWPQLAALVPAFESIRMTSAWAGHYAMNLADQNALIGPLPELENLYFANGFSGHGMQQSPAIGRAISELIIHGGFRTLDLSRFLAKRLETGDLIRELYVV